MDEHPDEVAAFMWGFTRSDGPGVQPWVEPVYRLRPRGTLTEDDERRRNRIDCLDDVKQRRLICAAGRLLWRAAAAARTFRDPPLCGQALANAVAGEIIDEMLDLNMASTDTGRTGPRLKLVATLTLMFVGVSPSMRQMQKRARARANPLRDNSSVSRVDSS
jgi:hypothetical protein